MTYPDDPSLNIPLAPFHLSAVVGPGALPWNLMMLLLMLASIGGLLSVLLLAFAHKALPGCGPRSACQAVLSSRWSRLGPIPVAIPAAILYAVNLAAALMLYLIPTSPLTPMGSACVQISAAILPGVALWFVIIQMAMGRFCRYCMLLHGVGLLFAAVVWFAQSSQPAAISSPLATPTLLLIAGTALALFITAQLLLPVTLYQILPAADLPDSLSASPPCATSEPTAAPSTVRLVAGRIELSLADWPRLESPQASNTIALLLDPTCLDCRNLYRLMRQALSQHRTNMACLIIPVPLDSACNPAVLPATPSHPDACAYARLSLALWQTRPSAFPDFLAWFTDTPTIPTFTQARTIAAHLAGPTVNLSLAMTNPSVDRQLQQAIDLYRTLNLSNLPQLLLPASILQGRVASTAELLAILDKHLPSPQADSRQSPGQARMNDNVGASLG